MVKRSIVLLFGAILCASVASCQKLSDNRPPSMGGQGQLPIEPAAMLDAVPLDYGDAIAVTTSPDYPAWSQIWFVKPDKSMVVIWVNAASGKMFERITLIPRR